MGRKVGIKEAEYLQLKSQIRDIHSSSLKGMDNALKTIQELDSKGGGFYTKELTPKIEAVIEELRSMEYLMETAFSDHEEIIDSFCTAIENYDVCS